MSAALMALCGIAVLLGGPVRSALQQGAVERKATAVATDATCFRFWSLEASLASASVRPEEIRRRVSDLAIGAMGARSAVAVAAQRLADDSRAIEPGVGAAMTGSDAWATLADACRRS